jgi:transcriptional regulator with XRE-family HTH domain
MPLKNVDGQAEQSTDLPETPIRKSVGQAIRAHRKARGLSARALAEKAGVSPSLISQIETEKLTPSVGTLIKIAVELGISLDEIFFETNPEPPAKSGEPERFRPADRHVGFMHAAERAEITLATGCHCQRLTPTHESNVDFMQIVYEAGGSSSEPDQLMRHQGREYGLVISGSLRVTIGFEEYELKAGDSIVFNAENPHRTWNSSDQPAVVVWMIVYADGEAAAHGPA